MIPRSRSPTSATSRTSSHRGPRRAGRRLAAEDPLITLESDKASMEVPSPAAGTVKEIKVKAGDRVSEGDVILLLETRGAPTAATRQSADSRQSRAHARQRKRRRPPPAARAGEGDIAGRAPGAGLGARRLYRRVPRRRSRHEGRAGRALPDARRRLPERRLHPVEGAAARRQGDRRGARDGRARPRVRQAGDRPRQARATGRTAWSAG